MLDKIDKFSNNIDHHKLLFVIFSNGLFLSMNIEHLWNKYKSWKLGNNLPTFVSELNDTELIDYIVAIYGNNIDMISIDDMNKIKNDYLNCIKIYDKHVDHIINTNNYNSLLHLCLISDNIDVIWYMLYKIYKTNKTLFETTINDMKIYEALRG